MLNILWGAMMLIGITYGAMTGRMGEITDAALSSAKEAVVLCITMAGIVGPGIVATLLSTVVAVVFCKMKDRKRRA